MTVIAWDGKTLAADRESSGTYVKFGSARKIGRAVDGSLYGIAGEAAFNRELERWFLCGAVPEAFPEVQRDKDDHSTLLWITLSGAVKVIQRSPYPIELLDTQYAIGAGKEAAMAVMLCGHDAIKAVEIASLVCVGCGNDIDALTLVTRLPQ